MIKCVTLVPGKMKKAHDGKCKKQSKMQRSTTKMQWILRINTICDVKKSVFVFILTDFNKIALLQKCQHCTLDGMSQKICQTSHI